MPANLGGWTGKFGNPETGIIEIGAGIVLEVIRNGMAQRQQS